MTVVVFDEQEDELPSADELVALAGIVLEGEGLPTGTEVAITLVDEPRIAELNEEHLGKSGPTDVLSFPLEDLVPGIVPESPGPNGPPPAIGDVFICPSYVREKALAAGVAFDDEIALMVVHGLLHLLGYDHVIDADAELMEAQERRYLARAGRVRP